MATAFALALTFSVYDEIVNRSLSEIHRFVNFGI
ncbi:hypothetical protein BgramDRAFT_5932 [Paraburkholderia graminis C4D1M]|uniref:Uncharacterized protein n=1 Tax=Paraburkholderia graminis (strain ATCC 700544 / DSM 17151 / LMG 18924 / NCIMB 13744 / C4D1M) TaxID=396598 RepID=B1G989_PARG4|nr:hypothetical protein BgramDRAFT_5932 [Paraburkholderia graminis C4D1M]